MTPTPSTPQLHDAWLDAGLRRLATYLHLQDLVAGRDVVEVWSGAHVDARGAQTLLQRGARGVTVVAEGAERPAQGARRATGTPVRTGLPGASADVVMMLDAPT